MQSALRDKKGKSEYQILRSAKEKHEFQNWDRALSEWAYCPICSNLFPPGLEPGTFRVWGERDNHYTTET